MNSNLPSYRPRTPGNEQPIQLLPSLRLSRIIRIFLAIAAVYLVAMLVLSARTGDSPKTLKEKISGSVGKASILDQNGEYATDSESLDTDLSSAQEKSQVPAKVSEIPVVVIACNRPTVTRCLDSLLKYRPSERFPIIVSLDCDHEETRQAILQYSDKITLIEQPDQSTPDAPLEHMHLINYYKIARTFKWTLNQIFRVFNYKQVIIVEDDMEVAPDFFDFFESFLPVLRADSSLLCVSAWNDNGKPTLAEESLLFYRSDFFPGLGWMLLDRLWGELETKWPTAFWDDWLRDPKQRLGRSCIRPELSRTLNFGKKGVSEGQFFDQHIAKIVLNKEPVSFYGHAKYKNTFVPHRIIPLVYEKTKQKPIQNLHMVDVRLFLKGNYDAIFEKQFRELSTEVSSTRLKKIISSSNPHSYDEYARNYNLLPFAVAKSRVEASTKNGVATEYDDVSSPYFCGRHCRRRFLITYQIVDNGKDAETRLREMVSILREWDLMDDIRGDIARTSYNGVVAFKAKLAHPQPLYPLGFDQGEDDREEFVMVYIAPQMTKKLNL